MNLYSDQFLCQKTDYYLEDHEYQNYQKLNLYWFVGQLIENVSDHDVAAVVVVVVVVVAAAAAVEFLLEVALVVDQDYEPDLRLFAVFVVCDAVLVARATLEAVERKLLVREILNLVDPKVQENKDDVWNERIDKDVQVVQTCE